MKLHWLMPCVLVLALGALVLVAAGVEAETIVVAGAALACPLMMLLMMGGGIHRLAHRGQDAHARADPAPEKPTTTQS